MSDDPLATIGELVSREVTAKPSGTDIEHSSTPVTSSNDPLNQIAELLLPKESEDNEQEQEQAPDEDQEQDQDTPDDLPERGAIESEPGGEEGGESERPELSLKSIADQLGIDVAELYDMEVPTAGDGEPVTLGQLKDLHQHGGSMPEMELTAQYETIQQELAERDQVVSSREVEAQALQNDLAFMQNEIMAHLPPERIAQLQERHNQTLATEGAMLLNAIPEFEDQQVFNNWRGAAIEYTARFGFKPSDLVISDHRLVVLLNHAMGLEKRLDRLASMKPTVPKPPKKKAVGNGMVPIKSSKASMDRNQHLDAVAKLVGGSL